MKIDKIALRFSNAFLIRGRRALLVDAGCAGDWAQLRHRLQGLGCGVKELSAVILTHAHSDHCGCAASLQSEGVPVIASRHAADSLKAGASEDMPDFFKLPLASVIRGFRAADYPKFAPLRADYIVDDYLDLSEFGIDGEIIATPAHTKSSLSVVLENNKACVGDMVMGGMLGLPPAWLPFFHPASEDNTAALRCLKQLRQSGYQEFFVGHGDVLNARDVDLFIERKGGNAD